MSTVRYETREAIAIVTIECAEVRNAVDGPTAAALADAFRRFGAAETSRSPFSPVPVERSAPAPI